MAPLRFALISFIGAALLAGSSTAKPIVKVGARDFATKEARDLGMKLSKRLGTEPPGDPAPISNFACIPVDPDSACFVCGTLFPFANCGSDVGASPVSFQFANGFNITGGELCYTQPQGDGCTPPLSLQLNTPLLDMSACGTVSMEFFAEDGSFATGPADFPINSPPECIDFEGHTDVNSFDLFYRDCTDFQTNPEGEEFCAFPNPAVPS